MAGANYMGGKRNAAKARAKDAVGRAQKGFFRRQQLNLLAQGVSNNRGRLTQSHLNASESNIDFAHARRNPNRNRGLVLPRTPEPNISPRTAQNPTLSPASASSNKSRSSKVLDCLDTSEPMFLRAAMNRILALPDLAGLSKRRLNAVTKRSHPPDSDEYPITNKRQRMNFRDDYSSASVIVNDSLRIRSKIKNCNMSPQPSSGELGGSVYAHSKSSPMTAGKMLYSELNDQHIGYYDDLKSTELSSFSAHEDSGYCELLAPFDENSPRSSPPRKALPCIASSPRQTLSLTSHVEHMILNFDSDTSLPCSSISAKSDSMLSQYSSSSSLGLGQSQMPEPYSVLPGRLQLPSSIGSFKSNFTNLDSASHQHALLPHANNQYSAEIFSDNKLPEVISDLLDYEDAWAALNEILGLKDTSGARTQTGDVVDILSGGNNRYGVGYVYDMNKCSEEDAVLPLAVLATQVVDSASHDDGPGNMIHSSDLDVDMFAPLGEYQRGFSSSPDRRVYSPARIQPFVTDCLESEVSGHSFVEDYAGFPPRRGLPVPPLPKKSPSPTSTHSHNPQDFPHQGVVDQCLLGYPQVVTTERSPSRQDETIPAIFPPIDLLDESRYQSTQLLSPTFGNDRTVSKQDNVQSIESLGPLVSPSSSNKMNNTLLESKQPHANSSIIQAESPVHIAILPAGEMEGEKGNSANIRNSISDPPTAIDSRHFSLFSDEPDEDEEDG